MNLKDQKSTTNRRDFLGTLAMGAGALTMASLAFPAKLAAGSVNFKFPGEDPEEWLNKIKGKHRIVFDVAEPQRHDAPCMAKSFFDDQPANRCRPR